MRAMIVGCVVEGDDGLMGLRVKLQSRVWGDGVGYDVGFKERM